MPATVESAHFVSAYPKELKNEEQKLLNKRGKPPNRDAIGLALSGGGVRSATFCLGVFQGLARLEFIRNIDYISTVSGGGYFGSFFGRLFTRKYVNSVEDVEKILLGKETAQSDQANEPATSNQQRIAVFFGGKPEGKRPSISLSIVATLAAVAILVVILTTVNALSHAIAWEFKNPLGAPGSLPNPNGFQDPLCPPDVGYRGGIWDLSIPFWACLVAMVISLLFGRSRPFLNWSTHHPLYSARLTRASLGASNLKRLLDPQGTVTNTIPKDDISLIDYWQSATIGDKISPFEKGAPIHLFRNYSVGAERDMVK